MKAKNLFLLVIALVVLVGLAQWTRRKPAARGAAEKPQKLVTFDVNSADRITIASAGETAVLAKAGADWKVASLWSFPADFATIADHVRRLAELEGLAVRGGEQALSEFGLDPAATNQAGAGPATVTFSSGDRELGRIALGEPRLSKGDGEMGGYPNGQYVRAGGGPVLLVKEFLGGLPRRPQDWARKALLNVARSDVEYVMVHLTNGAQYGLLADSNGVFQLNDLQAGETMKSEVANDVAGALQSLSLVNVLDPAKPAAETGLDRPSLYVAKLKNGLSYTLKVGAAVAADNGRVVQVGVDYEKPAPPPAEGTNAPPAVIDLSEQAKTDRERLAPWTFVISDYTAGNLIKPRADLIQPPTNAAPAEAASAPATPAETVVAPPAAP